MGIKIINAIYGKNFEIIRNMINDNKESNFFGREKRLKVSEIACLIKKDNDDIGFIYGTKESCTNILMMDMGIKREYRGKGYGTLALNEIQKINFNCFLCAQVKKENISAVKQLQNNAIFLTENEDCKYYLIQKDKIQEFKDTYSTEQINNIFNSESLDSGNNIKQAYESEKQLIKRRI